MKTCDKCNIMFDKYCYCPYCGKELEENMLLKGYNQAYGTWIVFNSANVALGAFEGYIDDIAFFLKDKGNRCLTFKKSEFKRIEDAKSLEKFKGYKEGSQEENTVYISFDKESGIDKMDAEERVDTVKNILKGRKTIVISSSCKNEVRLLE